MSLYVVGTTSALNSALDEHGISGVIAGALAIYLFWFALMEWEKPRKENSNGN